jgi:hypothetical protein
MCGIVCFPWKGSGSAPRREKFSPPISVKTSSEYLQQAGFCTHAFGVSRKNEANDKNNQKSFYLHRETREALRKQSQKVTKCFTSGLQVDWD